MSALDEWLDRMERFIAPLRVRVLNMITRARVVLVDDTQAPQSLQVEMLEGEIHDEVDRLQQYGFTGHPHPDAEAVALCVGGDRDHILIVAVDDGRYRPLDLAAGETAMYTDEDVDPAGLHRVHLKRGRIVAVEGAAVQLAGDDQAVVLETKLKSYIDSQIRAVFNAHTHPHPMGPTGTPSATIGAAGDISSTKVKAGA